MAIATRSKAPSGNGFFATFGGTVAVTMIALVLAFLLDRVGKGQTPYLQQVIVTTLYFVTAAVSLNLINGITGQFSIGHAAFAMVGANVGALLVIHSRSLPVIGGLIGGSPAAALIACAVFGALFAALLGLLIGFPSLRLRGDYLAVVTLGCGEILSIIFKNQELFGKSFGLVPPPIASIFASAVVTIIALLVSRNLLKTVHGLALLSVREDEVASASMGVPLTKMKLTAFLAGSALAGAAGALFTVFRGQASPTDYGMDISFLMLTMVVLGGTGSITGAALAAVGLYAIPEVLRSMSAISTGTLWAVILAIGTAIGLSKRVQLRSHQIEPGKRKLTYVGIVIGSLLLGLILFAVFGGLKTGPLGDYLSVKHQASSIKQPLIGLALIGFMLLRPQGIFGSSELSLDRLGRRLSGSGPAAAPLPIDPTLVPVTAVDRSRILLSLDRATIRFGGLVAVNNVSFDIYEGDLFGIIGPNGAGKTTCFNLITGVYAPTSGTITFGGRQIQGTPSSKIAKLGICRTFQNIRLFGSLSAIENVMIGAYLRRRTNIVSAMLLLPSVIKESDQIRKRAMAILKIVELDDVADVRSKDLPYGKQRRLEIARALATQPRLLLLDEPAAGMNPQEKMELLAMVKRIRDELGVTVLLIEHDMKFVMNLCEKIVVLDHGEEIAEGPPDAIKTDPKVIAAYLGEDVKTG